MKTDKELLNFLEKLNQKKMYTGKCILRLSATRRGWRLHETSGPGAVSSVRQAISDYMEIESENPLRQ